MERRRMTGVAFDLTFEKMRELRTAETENIRASYQPPRRDASAIPTENFQHGCGLLRRAAMRGF